MANVVAQPHFACGLRSGVRNNVGFCDEHTLLFPSGNSCVCYNTVQSSQRFLPGRPTSFTFQDGKWTFLLEELLFGQFAHVGVVPSTLIHLLFHTWNQRPHCRSSWVLTHLTGPERTDGIICGVSPGSERSQGMCALALSASRRYLAVSERGEKPTIAVLDLHHEQGRRRKVLTAGDLPAQEFVCMAFSPDSKYLIGQTGAPEWTLIFWLWEKHKVLATVKTSSSSNPVNQVSHARATITAGVLDGHSFIFWPSGRLASTPSTTCSSA